MLSIPRLGGKETGKSGGKTNQEKKYRKIRKFRTQRPSINNGPKSGKFGLARKLDYPGFARLFPLHGLLRCSIKQEYIPIQDRVSLSSKDNIKSLLNGNKRDSEIRALTLACSEGLVNRLPRCSLLDQRSLRVLLKHVIAFIRSVKV